MVVGWLGETRGKVFRLYTEGIREDSVHYWQLSVLIKLQKNPEMWSKSQKEVKTYSEGIIVKPMVGTLLLQLFKFWTNIFFLKNKIARHNIECLVNLDFKINSDFFKKKLV